MYFFIVSYFFRLNCYDDCDFNIITLLFFACLSAYIIFYLNIYRYHSNFLRDYFKSIFPKIYILKLNISQSE